MHCRKSSRRGELPLQDEPDSFGGGAWFFASPQPPVTPDNIRGEEPTFVSPDSQQQLWADEFDTVDHAVAFADWVNTYSPPPYLAAAQCGAVVVYGNAADESELHTFFHRAFSAC